MSYGWGDDSGSSSSGRSRVSSDDAFKSAREAYKEPKSTSSGASRSRSSSRSETSSVASRRDHDFSSARGKTPAPIDRKKLAVSTESTHPIVVCIDHTGSFISEVQIVLEKLPLLDAEVKRYAPIHEICFALIGDTTSDSHPFQVRDFASGEALEAHIKALFPEGNGGDPPESYDLAAYYFYHHCEMPKAVIKPIFIWVLDSDTRSDLEACHVKEYIGDDLQADLDSREMLKKLAEKFSVYVIYKGSDKRFWTKIYGTQNVILMEEPRDIVELIIGIVAGELGKYEDFAKRSSKRHSDKPDRVSRVMKSTHSLKEKSEAAKAEDAKAITTGDGKSKKSLRSKKLTGEAEE